METAGSVSAPATPPRAPATAANDPWELSKENVQPLRQGRRVTVLNGSLQPAAADDALWRRTTEQRRAYELDIRTYSGSDPLQPWFSYIQWAEQHYPRGGHEGHLDRLLDNCITLFRDSARYRQDARYVQLWLSLAQRSLVPLQVFQFMFQHGIGTRLAALYVAWAWHQELGGASARADAVLAQGLKTGAEPQHVLAEARAKLQERVAAAVSASGAEAQVAAAGGGEGRRALGVLRTTAGGAAPHVRAGANVAQSAVVAPLGRQSEQSRRGNRGLFVYQDSENSDPSALTAGGGGGTSGAHIANLPVASSKQKENVRRAEPWNQTSGSSGRGAATAVPRSRHGALLSTSGSRSGAGTAVGSFQVLVDSSVQSGGECGERSGAAEAAACDGSALPHPVGGAAGGGGGPALSVRKCGPVSRPVEDSGWNLPVAVFEPPNPSVRVMYCKQLIYAGADEVSFEELRAVRWQRQRQQQLRRAPQQQQRRSSDNCGATGGGVLQPVSLNRVAPNRGVSVCRLPSPVAGGAAGDSDDDKENLPPAAYVAPATDRRTPAGALVDVTSLVSTAAGVSSSDSTSGPSSADSSPLAAAAATSGLQSDSDLSSTCVPTAAPAATGGGSGRYRRRLLLDEGSQLTDSVGEAAGGGCSPTSSSFCAVTTGADTASLSTSPTGWSGTVTDDGAIRSDLQLRRQQQQWRLHQSCGDFRSLLTPNTTGRVAAICGQRRRAVSQSVSAPAACATVSSCRQLSEQLLKKCDTAAAVGTLSHRDSVTWLPDQCLPEPSDDQLLVNGTSYQLHEQLEVTTGAEWRATVPAGSDGAGATEQQLSVRVIGGPRGHWHLYVADELRRRSLRLCDGDGGRLVVAPYRGAFAFGGGGAVLVAPWWPSVAAVRARWPPGRAQLDTLALLLTAEALAVVARAHAAGFVLGRFTTADLCVSASVQQLRQLSRQLLPLSCTSSAADSCRAEQLLQQNDGGLLQLRGAPEKTVDCERLADGGAAAVTAARRQDVVWMARDVAYPLLFGTEAPDPDQGVGPVLQQLRRYWRVDVWREFFTAQLCAASGGCDASQLLRWRQRMLAAAVESPKLPDLLNQLADTVSDAS